MVTHSSVDPIANQVLPRRVPTPRENLKLRDQHVLPGSCFVPPNRTEPYPPPSNPSLPFPSRHPTAPAERPPPPSPLDPHPIHARSRSRPGIQSAHFPLSQNKGWGAPVHEVHGFYPRGHDARKAPLRRHWGTETLLCFAWGKGILAGALFPRGV